VILTLSSLLCLVVTIMINLRLHALDVLSKLLLDLHNPCLSRVLQSATDQPMIKGGELVFSKTKDCKIFVGEGR
jgi:hypothetical protein